VEARSGLRLLAELPGRDAVPPLCSAAHRCGRGIVDGRIEGWKMLGQLTLSGDCASLSQVRC